MASILSRPRCLKILDDGSASVVRRRHLISNTKFHEFATLRNLHLVYWTTLRFPNGLDMTISISPMAKWIWCGIRTGNWCTLAQTSWEQVVIYCQYHTTPISTDLNIVAQVQQGENNQLWATWIKLQLKIYAVIWCNYDIIIQHNP